MPEKKILKKYLIYTVSLRHFVGIRGSVVGFSLVIQKAQGSMPQTPATGSGGGPTRKTCADQMDDM